MTVDPSSRRKTVLWRKQRSDPRARRRAEESKSTTEARAWYRDGGAVLWMGVVESPYWEKPWVVLVSCRWKAFVFVSPDPWGGAFWWE